MTTKKMDFTTLRDELIKLNANPDGIAMTDILALPTLLRRVFRGLVRKKQITLAELAVALDLPPDETRELGGMLVKKGYLQLLSPKDEPNPVYLLHFSPKPATQMANRVWNVLDDL